MTDPEITALAREYAEEIRKDTFPFFPRPLPNSMEVLVQKDQKEAEKLIRFLLRRYCLVEKSKLREAYKDAQKDQYNTERDFALTLAGRNRSAVLVELFPEIAEEVEDA